MAITVAMAGSKDRIHGIDNFGATAVVECDAEDHAGVLCSGFGGFARVFLYGFGEIVRASQKAHADIVPLQEGHLLAEIFAKELHEKFDLRFGAAPVFHGEGVEGERLDVEARAGFDGHASGLRAGSVTCDAGKMAFLGPAAVAVHDDGDVAGQPAEVEFFEEACLFSSNGPEIFGGGEMVTRVGHDDSESILFMAQS